MLTPPQLEGQWAMEAAEGIYSIPLSSPDAADAAGGMAAKHARANAMAQTITLLELMIKPISLSVRGVRCRDYILGYRNYFIFKSYRDTVSCLRRYRIKPSLAKILTRHKPIILLSHQMLRSSRACRVRYARSLAFVLWPWVVWWSSGHITFSDCVRVYQGRLWIAT